MNSRISALEQELFRKVQEGDVQAVRKLCRSGVNAQIRHPDLQMNSPLHCAVLGKYLDICKYLIEEAACDPYMVNASGQSSLEYAQVMGSRFLRLFVNSMKEAADRQWTKTISTTKPAKKKTAVGASAVASSAAADAGVVENKHKKPGKRRKNDLYVVGAGSLGSRVAATWKNLHGNSIAVGETLTEHKHNVLRSENVIPSLRNDREQCLEKLRNEQRITSFPNVIYCIPPSSFRGVDGKVSAQFYAEDVRKALQLWNRQGAFVFISATSVYKVPEESPDDEESSIAVLNEFSATDATERSIPLLEAEQACLEQGGVVLRCVGLYDSNRGPHKYWYEKAGRGELLEGDPSSLVNLVHYQDAAHCVVKIIASKAKSKVYVACDGSPMSRQAICDATFGIVKYSRFKWKEEAPPQFVGEVKKGAAGKRMDCSYTMKELAWTPFFKSFSDFCDKTKQMNA